MKQKLTPALTLALGLTTFTNASITLYDDDFADGSLATNPGIGGGSVALNNGVGSGSSASESGSIALITEGSSGSTAGIRTTNSFDLSDSNQTYTATWNIASWGTSGGTTPQQRVFLSLQSNDSFLFTGDSGDTRVLVELNAAGNNSYLRFQERVGTSNVNSSTANFALPALDGDLDGFTATLVLDSLGFSFTTTGLDASNEADITDTWASLGTTYADVVAPGTFHMSAYLQDSLGTGLELGVDRMSLAAIPEPSSLALLGIFAALGSLIRRR